MDATGVRKLAGESEISIQIEIRNITGIVKPVNFIERDGAKRSFSLCLAL